jgi:hypothetical protein
MVLITFAGYHLKIGKFGEGQRWLWKKVLLHLQQKLIN